MSLEHKIWLDWCQALKNNRKKEKVTLALLRSEIHYFEKEHGSISDEDIHGIIKVMIATRKEFIASLRGKHKVHFMAKEAIEIFILNEYLPESEV